jgi:hypothetical protein
MSGIIVRNRAKAAIKKCTIENVEQSGIVVSDSRDVSITSSFVFSCKEAALSCYDHSEVHIRSSFLVGPSGTGINVFTGGFIYATDTTIAGVLGAYVWIHHGGSGRFVSTLIHSAMGETREAILQQIQEVPLLAQRAEIADEKVFRLETTRSVVATGTFVVGRGIVDVVRNQASEDAQPGEAAIAAKCKICGKEAKDCFFAFCGHAIYCRTCWNEMPEKPKRCELCSMPIEKVASPIDCSHDEEATCGICMTGKADAIVVPCGHLICADCGRAWFEKHSECPYCREVFAKCKQFVSYA